jgi:folate-dependent tRNA-U54 methylase TrmFO/GidA
LPERPGEVRVLEVIVTGEGVMEAYTGVKVFSTTLARDREQMGETITRWLAEHPGLEIVDREVRQSSDNEFHCLTITLFYREKGTA